MRKSNIEYYREGEFEAEQAAERCAREIELQLANKEAFVRLKEKFAYQLARELGPAFLKGDKVVAISDFPYPTSTGEVEYSHVCDEGNWYYYVCFPSHHGRKYFTIPESYLAPAP